MNLSKHELNYINIQSKEIKQKQLLKEYPYEFSMPIGLQYELTSKCNLRCLHCYNRSGDSDKETLMKVSDWIRLSESIVENGGIFQCIISGGEPLLLGENLFKIMDVLHNDGTGFVLITNGYLVTQEIVNKLCKYRFFWIQVSIDGHNSDFHDKFRGKKGSWENAVNAALLFTNRGLPLTIASSITPNNIDYMEEMADLAYSLGASAIIFGEIMLSGRAHKNIEILLNDEQKKGMQKNINTLAIKYKNRMQIKLGASDTYQLNLHKTIPNKTAIIRPNGDVRLDCTAPFIGGNVLKENFYTIWNEKMKNSWKNEKVTSYIKDITERKVNDRKFINHVDNDILL